MAGAATGDFFVGTMALAFPRAGLFALTGVALACSTARAQVRATERIRAIVMDREAVFDSVEARFWAYRLANTLHVATRPWVVRRELLFGEGDRYDSALVAESERNLRALGVFRDVTITPLRTDSGIVIRVRTEDAWTTTLGVSAATSGTQSVLDLSLQEGNLLGTRTVAVLAYRNDPDRSSIAAGFDTPRALADRVGLGVSIIDRSDGRAGSFPLRVPFLSLSARSGGSLVTSFSEGRVLRFAEGNGLPVDSLWRETALIRADAATALAASPAGFVRVGVQGYARRDDMVPLLERADIPHTVTLTAGPYVSLRAPRYVRVRNVARMGRTEDVDLGPFVSAGVLAAPRAWGYDRAGVGFLFSGSVGMPLPSGFARLGVRTSGLQTTAGTDSASAEAATSVVLQPGDRHLVVLHASGGVLRNPSPGYEFDLGLGTGLRAFPAHAFTGDRQYVLAAEYRLLAIPRLFGLAGVGAAVFAGQAGAWYHGSRVRRGTEVGAGLRIASLREAGGVWRLDVSRRLATDRLAAGWVASLGRGFVFGGSDNDPGHPLLREVTWLKATSSSATSPSSCASLRSPRSCSSACDSRSSSATCWPA